MDMMAIIVAAVLAFLAFRFITGMIKFVVLAVIVVAVILFMTGGIGA